MSHYNISHTNNNNKTGKLTVPLTGGSGRCSSSRLSHSLLHDRLGGLVLVLQEPLQHLALALATTSGLLMPAHPVLMHPADGRIAGDRAADEEDRKDGKMPSPASLTVTTPPHCRLYVASTLSRVARGVDVRSSSYVHLAAAAAAATADRAARARSPRTHRARTFVPRDWMLAYI